MNNAATFDVLAPAYDAGFVHSLTGQAQRRISRQWLQPLLPAHTGMDILEINCGTGADALWLAEEGHTVTATDASPAMIQVAQQNALVTASPNQPVFYTCAFDQLGQACKGQQFDCIFSNFAGLNCVSPQEMQSLAQQLCTLLRPGGYIAVVLFGKHCVWEMSYYLLKGRPRQAFRRLAQQPVMVPLTDTVQQPVYYYSSKAFAQLLLPLQLVTQRPVGLFVPPSYLEPYMQRHQHFFRLLTKLETALARAPFLSSLADHSFMLFKK